MVRLSPSADAAYRKIGAAKAIKSITYRSFGKLGTALALSLVQAISPFI